MNRLLAPTLLLALTTNAGGGERIAQASDPSKQPGQTTTIDAGADGVVYSGWLGGCRFGELADFSCIMRLEARSATGARLGFIAFGQGEMSRFLFIDLELPASRHTLSLVTKIDDKPVANGKMVCRKNEAFCSATLKVDDDLLDRLAAGSVLSVETRRHKIKVKFPLDDFQRARANLL